MVEHGSIGVTGAMTMAMRLRTIGQNPWFGSLFLGPCTRRLIARLECKRMQIIANRNEPWLIDEI